MRKPESDRIRVRLQRIAAELTDVLEFYHPQFEDYHEKLLRFAIADLLLLSVKLQLKQHDMLPWEASLPAPQ